MKKIIFYFLPFLFMCTSIHSQENTKGDTNKKKSLNIEDAVLGYYKGLYPSSLTGISWTSENKYSYQSNDEFIILEPNQNYNSKSRNTISIEDINSSFEGLELTGLPWGAAISKNTISFNHINSFYHLNLKDKTNDVIQYPENAASIDVSPNKKTVAYTIDNNLYIANKNNSQTSITNYKDKNIVSGQAIHRFEFGISKGIFWSPSNNSLAFYQKDETDVAEYPLLNINTTPGSLTTTKYPMAGQKSEKARIGIYDFITKKSTYLNTGEIDDHYLTNLTWGPASKFIYVAEVNRDQNHMKLIKYNASTGKQEKILFEEKNDKWVEPEYGLYFLPGNNNEFIWLSERDGFMNLYHYNTDGKLIRQITNNKWVTTSILGINEKTNEIIFTGTGTDPREMHAFKVGIQSNSPQKQITNTEGVHRFKISPNKRYLIDQYSSLNNPGTIKIHDLIKSKSWDLYQSENPLSGFETGITNMINLKTDDNINLYGRMITPANFKKNKKYPVLIYVYGGPHAQLVTNSWLGGASLWMHWLANQGYIVFTLDGRGSSNRGFDFESIIHRELGKVEIEDQLLGVNYLKSLNYVDPDRIAVHGWSFGGYMTTSLMTKHPEIFTTGVAGGPVIDWKWYEVMYGERYMDTPDQNPDGYKNTSLLEYAKDLKGKLLMIHGTADDVVVMQHNLAFIQKCVSEGIQVDFFPYPMHAHNVRGKDRVHLMTKVLNYVIDNNK